MNGRAARSIWDEPHDGVRTVRGATIYRRNGTWGSRWLFLSIAAAVGVALLVIAWQLRGVSTGRPGPSWGRVAACWAAPPFMIALFCSIAPRTSLRIGRRGLQHIMSYPCRRRSTLQWSEIERVCLGTRVIRLETGKRRLWLDCRSVAQAPIANLRNELLRHLSPRFDLTEGGAGESSPWHASVKLSRVVLYLVVALHIPLIVASSFTSRRMMVPYVFAAFGALLFAAFWHTLARRRSLWRYPQSSEPRLQDAPIERPWSG